MDFKDEKPNTEDNEKLCQIADGQCSKCIFGDYIGKDSKYSLSKHCSESYLGKCIVCEDNFYLGLDNKFIGVEHCIYSNIKEECLECSDKYYYSKTDKSCKTTEGKYEHC